MKYVLNKDTGTFFAVSEAVLFDDEDLTERDKDMVRWDKKVPESVKGVALSAIFEKLA
jgi:hypothetical protein